MSTSVDRKNGAAAAVAAYCHARLDLAGRALAMARRHYDMMPCDYTKERLRYFRDAFRIVNEMTEAAVNFEQHIANYRARLNRDRYKSVRRN